MIKKIIHSVAWSSFYRLAGILAAFLINVLLARLMEKRALGLYFITFSLVMFLAILMRAGIKQTALKTVARARNNGENIIAVTKKIMLVTTMITSLGFLAMVSGIGEWIAIDLFKSTLMAEHVGIIAFWAAMIAMAAPIGETLRALHFPGWGAAMDMALNNILIMIVIMIGYISGYEFGYVEVLLTWVIASVVVNIAGLTKLVHYLVKIEQRSAHNITGYKDIFSGLVPILVLNLSTYLTINASLWIVGNTLGHEDAAIYGAVLKLYNLLALPLLIINLGLEPHIADMYYSDKKDRLELSIRLSASAGFYVTLSMSFMFVMLGEDILRLIYGVGFETGFVALLVILGGNVINVWTGSCVSILVVSGRERILAVTNFAGAVICIVMSMYLVSSYGLVGVAGSVACAVAFVNLVIWWIVNQRLGINTAALINPIQVFYRLKALLHAEV